MRAYISNIRFNSGVELSLKKDDIVVFVGSNNVGKSQALQDISSLCERAPKSDPRFPIIVKDIEIQYEDLDSVIDDAMEYGWAKEMPGGISFQGEYYSQKKVKKQHTDKGFGCFNEVYLFQSRPGDRSDIIGSSYYGSDDYEGYDPIQFIADNKDLRNKASNAFCKVYGQDLLAHRLNVNSMYFCIGSESTLNERTEGTVGNDSLDEYKKYMDSLPKLNDQSDGVKGFASIVVNLALDHKKVFLLDEPETFIHPPQVQILGSTICEFSEDRQVFIATHSQDIIKGLLEYNPNRVRIIKMTRDGEYSNTFNVLDNDTILTLWRDPFLKYSDILSSLFYEDVIVCESDSDCKIYGVLLNDVKLEKGMYSQALFLPAYGKQRVYKVVSSLKSLSINVVSIFDIDILSDIGDLSKIIQASGGNVKYIKDDHKVLSQKLQAASTHINRDSFREKVLELIEQSDKKELSKDEVDAIKKNLEIVTKWGYLKKYGYKAIPAGEGIQAFERIEKYLSSLGIYIVRQGELENFIKSISGHGPEWVSKVLEQYPDHSNPIYDEMKDFVRSWGI